MSNSAIQLFIPLPAYIVRWYRSVLCSLLFVISIGDIIHAQSSPVVFDTLAGTLPKVVKKQKNPYLVIADIEVAPNREVTIEPGVIFLFKNFTGIHVQGKLYAEGTREHPIIFTSEFDTRYNPGSTMIPNPYDWNGIFIHSSGFGTRMHYCHIFYTVYGLLSETKYIQLKQMQFRDNGKSDLIIENRVQSLSVMPYDYNIYDTQLPAEVLRDLDTHYTKRLTLRYSGIALFVIGTTGSIYFGTEFKKSNAVWRNFNLQDIESQKNNTIAPHTYEDYQRARQQRNKDLGRMCLGIGIGLLGALGFTYTFTF